MFLKPSLKSKDEKNILLVEKAMTLIAEGAHFEGNVSFTSFTRVYGSIIGKIECSQRASLILAKSSRIQGSLIVDTLWIEGHVNGDIFASSQVILLPSAHVIGDITTPSLRVEFGAVFEGACRMEPYRAQPSTSLLTSLSPQSFS